MTRKLWIIPFLLLLIVGQVWSRPFDKVKDSGDYKHLSIQGPEKAIHPDSPIDASRFSDLPSRDPQRDPVAVGEDLIVGFTWYDYQHNGSIGKMIAKDQDGGVHFAWMAGYNAQQDPRHVLYNYIDPDGNLANEPDDRIQVDNADRSGYCMIDVVPNDGRAVIFYHVLGHVENDPEFLGTAMSADWMAGIGAFQASYPEPWPEVQLAWPKGTVDNQQIAHTLSCENTGDDVLIQRVAYWRGVPDEDLAEWSWNEDEVAIEVDITGVISQVASASPQSDQVVLAWHHNRIGAEMQRENGDWEQARGGWQRNNDIYYIVSEDGENFDWDDGVMDMTEVAWPIPELAEFDMEAAYGDRYRPYCDVDIQFDPWEGGDDLYAVFAASGFDEEPVADDDPEPVDLVYAVHGHLWFWNSIEDTITMIYDGWYNNYFSNPAAERNFRPGAWRLNADRGSIAFNPDDPGTIYVVWTRFPHIADATSGPDGIELEFFEGAQDTSVAGYLNADIMVSISSDYGITWRDPINVTETIWDGEEAPEPGECLSENWPSVAEIADGALHITYILDLDAGGIPQTEGTATNNPVIYHRIELGDLRLNDPVEVPEGLTWHAFNSPIPQISNVIRTVGVPLPDEEVRIEANVEPGNNERQIDNVFIEYVIGGEDGEDTLTVEMAYDADDEIYFGNLPGIDEGVYMWYRVHAIDNEGDENTKPEGFWGAYIARPENGLNIHDVQYVPDGWLTDHSPYNGFEVTVTGTVTTDGEFADLYGAVAIQSEAADWSGLFIRGNLPDLNFEALVRVTGTVMERDPDDPVKWRYLTYIDVESEEDVTDLGEGEAPVPLDVQLEDLNFSTRAEELEGVLVRLENVTLDGETLEDGMFWQMSNMAPNNADLEEAWMNLQGSDIMNLREDLDYNRWGRWTRITFVEGVFTENQAYGIAPRGIQDFGALGIETVEQPQPRQISLEPAYPNPFNSTTRVSFEMPEAGYVKVGIYDLNGRLVTTVVESELATGHYTTLVDASSFATGVYVLRLDAGATSISQKLVLMK